MPVVAEVTADDTQAVAEGGVDARFRGYVGERLVTVVAVEEAIIGFSSKIN